MLLKLILLFLLSIVTHVHGAIVEKDVIYHDGGVELEGLHVYDDSFSTKRPGILVIHQWTGLSENEKHRSRMLAKLGYNVFAADIYGKGIRPQVPGAGIEASKYKTNRMLFRQRLLSALTELKANELTDHAKIGAIGYCFGGTGVLELARAGANISGVVSFHGGLDAAASMGAAAGQVPAKVLVLHGADDPYVPVQQLNTFQKEMSDAHVDLQVVIYSGAVHAFTQKEAGNDPGKGVAYQALADARSWVAMQQFFKELFE